MSDYVEGHRRLATHILSSRVVVAGADSIELKDFWTFMPLECHWCKEERKVTELHTRPDKFICCIDKKTCQATRHRKFGKPDPKELAKQKAAEAAEAAEVTKTIKRRRIVKKPPATKPEPEPVKAVMRRRRRAS